MSDPHPNVSKFCQTEEELVAFQEVKYELARESKCCVTMDCFFCGEEGTLFGSLFTGGKGLVIRCSSCKKFLKEGPHVDLSEYANHDVRNG